MLGAKTGGMDGSSVGHPGKYTLCLAEDEPPAPWEPLRVELGYELGDTTVTLVPTEGPRQVANHLNPDATGILKTFATAMRSPATFAVGKAAQVVLLFGPEHTTALIDQGWTRRAAREFLAEESRITPAELEAAGVLIETGAQHDMAPGPDGKLPVVARCRRHLPRHRGRRGRRLVGLPAVVGAQAARPGRHPPGEGHR